MRAREGCVPHEYQREPNIRNPLSGPKDKAFKGNTGGVTMRLP